MGALSSRLKQALAAGPLVELVDAGLPPHVDTKPLVAAQRKGIGGIVDALLEIVDTPAKAHELAARLELTPSIAPPESQSLRKWARELVKLAGDVGRVVRALE